MQRDMVDVTIIDADKNRGQITSIHKRTSYLRRPSLANCSHLLCVCTLSEPPLNLEALDRCSSVAVRTDSNLS
jgi:putative ribosome biogenesis GTPase RsgA